MRPTPIPALLLLLASSGSEACDGDGELVVPDGDGTALYEDVSATHLPGGLGGLSMDARPADVDGDGDLDVVVASEFAPNILLLNDGAGRFADASDRLPRTSRDSEDVGVADFDADGDLDIVIVSEDDQVNELYLNDGTGRFADASDRLTATGRSNAVVVADLTGDGRPDIVIGNNGQNAFLANDGAGGFVDETAARLPAVADVTQDLELGDVDGDGDLDIVAGNEDANRLVLNDGRGAFVDASDRIPLRAAPEETREADLGDVDGDGDLDLLFANVVAFVPGADPQNRLLLNDGTGRFVDETTARLPADAERSFDGDLVDLDGDGDLDVLTSNADLGGGLRRWRALVNDGGTFRDATDELLPASARGAGFDAEHADFDGDGRPDLYLASRGSADRLLLRR